MKQRTGFVSNSSSSSYIVAFPEEITIKEQLYNYLYPNTPINLDKCTVPKALVDFLFETKSQHTIIKSSMRLKLFFEEHHDGKISNYKATSLLQNIRKIKPPYHVYTWHVYDDNGNTEECLVHDDTLGLFWHLPYIRNSDH